TSGLMTPGVSRALATRRATQISDVRYGLNLDLSQPDTAHGLVHITFRLKAPSDVIVDCRGPSLSNVVINDVASLAVEWNGGHVRVPARLLKAGQNTFAAHFTTPIAPAGAPIIRFHDETDG